MSSNHNLSVSPLAPAAFPALEAVPGIHMAAVAAGIDYTGRLDLLLMRFKEGTSAAGLFTQNQIKAAPVRWCLDAFQANGGKARGLVVNAGNANAYCGARGVSAAKRVAHLTAEHFSCDPNEILLASTGVIGKALSATPFIKPLARLVEGMSNTLWQDAAKAIMTTDTFPKGASATTDLDGEKIVFSGIAKGSGMIAPNMATMLAFVGTNAAISPECLQALLADSCAASFNAISVDGDQSTNDSVMLFATGETNASPINSLDDPRIPVIKEALQGVMTDLATQIVRDGEGADHLIRIDVSGCKSVADAQAIARSIALSPLVKTAIAGGDANWGRIIMAAGNAGVEIDEQALVLHLGDQLVASGGSVMRAYSDEIAADYLKSDEISIRLSIGAGNESATAWTCDLTHRYIDINADYRS